MIKTDHKTHIISITWCVFVICFTVLFFRGATAPIGRRSLHCRGFTIILRHTTVGRTPLDEWSARRRDLYPTTQNTDNRQDIHVPGVIRTFNPSRRATADIRLRPRGHWDRLYCILICIFFGLQKQGTEENARYE